MHTPKQKPWAISLDQTKHNFFVADSHDLDAQESEVGDESVIVAMKLSWFE